MEKCDFRFSEGGVSGVTVARDGTRVAPSKVKALEQMDMPINVGETVGFVGVAGFLWIPFQFQGPRRAHYRPATQQGLQPGESTKKS